MAKSMKRRVNGNGEWVVTRASDTEADILHKMGWEYVGKIEAKRLVSTNSAAMVAATDLPELKHQR